MGKKTRPEAEFHQRNGLLGQRKSAPARAHFEDENETPPTPSYGAASVVVRIGTKKRPTVRSGVEVVTP